LTLDPRVDAEARRLRASRRDARRSVCRFAADAILQRGVRADEAATESGFGLTIVRDLSELYGGSVVLGQSSKGGVRAGLGLAGTDPQMRQMNAD
jgi:signal transduction histidine kinase